MFAALVAEVVMTAFFLIIILGATGKGVPAGFAPIAIGLALTLIHLISIPVTNTSVNPARWRSYNPRSLVLTRSQGSADCTRSADSRTRQTPATGAATP